MISPEKVLNKIQESPFEVNENSENRYFRGKINFIIRLYYFLQQGLNEVNNFKNIILGIAALAVLTRIEANYLLIGLLGLSTVPIVTTVGWLWTVRGKKSTDYYVWRYASPISRYNVQIQEKQMAQNEKIIELLEKLNETTGNRKI